VLVKGVSPKLFFSPSPCGYAVVKSWITSIPAPYRAAKCRGRDLLSLVCAYVKT
jgi:hypothetical protein